MKKVNENLGLLEELFEAWAEEVNENVVGVFASVLNDVIGHAVIDADSLYMGDILKIDRYLKENGFKVTQIDNAPVNCMGIWFMSMFDYEY